MAKFRDWLGARLLRLAFRVITREGLDRIMMARLARVIGDMADAQAPGYYRFDDWGEYRRDPTVH